MSALLDVYVRRLTRNHGMKHDDAVKYARSSLEAGFVPVEAGQTWRVKDGSKRRWIPCEELKVKRVNDEGTWLIGTSGVEMDTTFLYENYERVDSDG